MTRITFENGQIVLFDRVKLHGTNVLLYRKNIGLVFATTQTEFRKATLENANGNQTRATGGDAG